MRQPICSTRPRPSSSARAYSGSLIWGFGFMVVAGEWFAMWQSQTWNAQEPAFRILLTVLAVLIFVNQHDVDLPDAAPPPKRTPKRRGTDRK